MLPLTNETFSREFSFFSFSRFCCMTNSDGLKLHIRTECPVLTLQVAGGKWRCLGRFKHIPPSNPRSQRRSGCASLGHSSPIPGTYYTNPVCHCSTLWAVFRVCIVISARSRLLVTLFYFTGSSYSSSVLDSFVSHTLHYQFLFPFLISLFPALLKKARNGSVSALYLQTVLDNHIFIKLLSVSRAFVLIKDDEMTPKISQQMLLLTR